MVVCSFEFRLRYSALKWPGPKLSSQDESGWTQSIQTVIHTLLKKKKHQGKEISENDTLFSQLSITVFN